MIEIILALKQGCSTSVTLITSIFILQYSTDTRNWTFPTQHINDSSDMWSCRSCILFAIIRHKQVKNIMMGADVQRKWGCFLVCGSAVIQINAFNRHILIIAMIFRLDLVWNTVYHTIFIIPMSQHIMKIWTTIEYLLTRVATVMSYKNAYIW